MAVFTNRAVPARVRLALNLESGLNDGIATPIVTFFLALVASEEDAGSHHWVQEALSDIAVDVGVGAAAGLVGGRLLVAARRWGGTTPASEQVGALALALLSFAGASAAGANGFAAAQVPCGERGNYGFPARRGRGHSSTGAIPRPERPGGAVTLVWLSSGSSRTTPAATSRC